MSIFPGSPSRQDKPVPGPTGAAEVAAHIHRLLPNVRSGTLCFWGVWFGRPHDNRHFVVRAEAEGDCLVVHFNDDEILKVWHPQDWRVDAHEFVIRSASRVIWQWYWYGYPHTPVNLKSYEFIRQGTEISFQSTFPPSHCGTPTLAEPAVQIH